MEQWLVWPDPPGDRRQPRPVSRHGHGSRGRVPYPPVRQGIRADLAVDEIILLHPPLPLVGVSIVMERECQQNDSLVTG